MLGSPGAACAFGKLGQGRELVEMVPNAMKAGFADQLELLHQKLVEVGFRHTQILPENYPFLPQSVRRLCWQAWL